MALDRDGALTGATWLLEREAELALIHELVGSVGREPGRALVIEGPAGIGKSALLWTMLGEAQAAGVRTLVARANEFDGGANAFRWAWIAPRRSAVRIRLAPSTRKGCIRATSSSAGSL
jgi:hypothetical protein